MMISKSNTGIFFFFCINLLISACGGGSSSGNGDCNNSGSDNVPLTGYFIDGPIAGVRYQTASQSGFTASDGAFQYRSGETISFKLGDTVLGESTAKARITLFDLVPGAEPVVGIDQLYPLIRNKSPAARRFHQVINLAVLLQTVDQDGDPENGIVITADVAALFSGISLNFQQIYADFAWDKQFRRMLNQGNAAHLFSDHRIPRNPGFAMQHLYNALDIDPKIIAITQVDRDRDNNGSIDVIKRYTYNEKGELLLEERDINGSDPNLPYSVATLDYDAYGRLIHYTLDSNNDGIYDDNEFYSYDDDGYLDTFQSDYDGDSIINYIRTYHHDEVGKRLYFDLDSNMDGINDGRADYLYNDQDQFVRYEFDAGLDDVLDLVNSYAYDENGNLLRKEVDSDGDGQSNEIWTYAYDSENRKIREEKDRDGDGEAESIVHYTYDDMGRRVSIEFGSNIVGIMDSIYTSVYDQNGRFLRYEADHNGDGEPDSIEYKIYDDNGNPVREEHDDDVDGDIDEIWYYTVTQIGWQAFFNDFFD